MATSSEPRRSSRLKGSPQKQPKYDIDDQSDRDDYDDPPVQKSTRKRAKTARSSMGKDAVESGAQQQNISRRKSGKLSMLLHMPLDVLFEILGYLRPYDLLRLTRMTKPLRKLLLNPSSRTVWMDALAGVPGLPPCPEFMQEPQYTRLCFEPVCHFCGTSGVQEVLWAQQARTCKKCMSEEDERGPYFQPYDWHAYSMPNAFPAYPLVPWSNGVSTHRGTKFTLRRRYDAVKLKLVDLAKDEKGLEAYKTEQKQHVEEMEEFTKQCSSWYNNARNEHFNDLDEIRKKRREAIEEHLRDLGWGKELNWLRVNAMWPVYREYKFHKLINQPRLLTPRIWSNIQNAIIEFLQPMRTQRRDELWNKALSARRASLKILLDEYGRSRPMDEAQPKVGDLYHDVPAFRAVFDVPLDEDEHDLVTTESFEEAMAQLPDAASAWRKSCKQALVKRIPLTPSADSQRESSTNSTADTVDEIRTDEQEPVADADTSRLDLATSLFSCLSCKNHNNRVFHASNALAHSCFWGKPQETQPGFGPHKVLDSWPWRTSWVKFHDSAAAEATRLVEMCGLDPARATAADMDALDTRFTCAGCPKCTPERGQRGMTWRKAVQHVMPPPASPYERRMLFSPPFVTPTIVRLPAGDAAEVRLREAHIGLQTIAEHPAARGTCAWVCMHCRQGRLAALRMEEHLRQIHDISRPLEPSDFCMEPDYFAPLGIHIWINVPEQHTPST